MIDNKILKHKYLFIFLVFAFSVLFGKIDSQAAEGLNEYYFNTYGLDEKSTSYTYHINECKFSTDFNLCFVFAGNYEEVDLNGNVFNASRYYPCMSYKDGVDTFYYSYTKTRLNGKYEVINTTSSSSSLNFYNLDYIKNGGYVDFVCSVWKPLETNIPIFSTFDQAENYLLTGDTNGQINKDISNFHDFSQDTYTVDIPVPELSKLCFTGFDINNNPNDIYNVDLIIQTNYYGVSYQKKGLVNVYAVDYDWIYKKHYYNISDSKSNHVKKSQINVLDDFGVDIFSDYVSDFISWGRNYPNITDLPNYSFIWYNSVASQTYYNTRHVQEDLIDETTLKITGQPEVIYYVRFYDDSGNFGRWARYLYRADDVKLHSVVTVGQLDIGEDGSYIIDDNGDPSTSQTITTNQNFITNETEDNRLDFDITSATNFFDYIKNIFDSIISSLNSFGNLIKACLGFLPDDLLNAIVAGIVIMLFVGVVKVVRG